MMTDQEQRTDVLIVGAGPAGLVLACDLARRGVDFRVLEARTFRADESLGSRGKGIQPRTLEIYDDLGMVDDVYREGGPYFPGMIWKGTVQLGETRLPRVEPRPPSVENPHPSTWMLPQPQALNLLEDKLANYGKRIEYGSEVVSILDNGPCVMADVRKGDGQITRIRSRYLVGADGARGIVRRTISPEFLAKTIDSYPMVTGDLEVEGPDRNHWHMWNEATGGAVWLLPLPHSTMFQLYAKWELGGEPDVSPEGIRKLVEERTGFKTGKVNWASAFGIRVGMVLRFRKGRIFLVGDSAHVHPPAGGQGMNTSVQDAYNLGWKLGQVVAHDAPDKLLDSYEAERIPVAAGLLDFVEEMYRSWVGKEQRPSAADEEGKNLQLDLGYRHGDLVVGGGSGVGPQSGDRVPDAPLRTQTGNAIRLHDLLRGPHFTLLVMGHVKVPRLSSRQQQFVHVVPVTTSGLPGAHETVNDPYGQLLATYGAGYVLIRPDGYVGMRGAAEIDVHRYLAQCGAGESIVEVVQ